MNARQKHVKQAIEYLTRYMKTYDKQTGYLDYTDETIIDDVLYGLGVAIGGREYQMADGFAKFKARLAKHIANNAVRGAAEPRTLDGLVGDLRLQVETMRRIADDTEASMRGETDAKRIAFYDGRVCCLREQALNIEDIIANAEAHVRAVASNVEQIPETLLAVLVEAKEEIEYGIENDRRNNPLYGGCPRQARLAQKLKAEIEKANATLSGNGERKGPNA